MFYVFSKKYLPPNNEKSPFRETVIFLNGFSHLQPPQDVQPGCRFRTLGAIASPPSAVSRS